MKFKTLGCRLNTFETETIKSITEKLDFKNLTFVNTCSVTKEASKNSKKYVRQLKKSSPHNTIIVSGCDAHIEKETYMKMPEVDVVVGNDVKLDESIWGEIKKSGRSGFLGESFRKHKKEKTDICRTEVCFALKARGRNKHKKKYCIVQAIIISKL